MCKNILNMNELKIIAPDAGQRLSTYCQQVLSNKTISFIKRNINKGNIKVNGKKVKDDHLLKEDDVLTFYLAIPKNLNDNFKDCQIKVKIFYEDENIIIFDKQKGVYCQEDKNEKNNTLNNYLKLYLYKKKLWDGKSNENEPALVNRIDVNTEGLVIAGKNKKVVRNLNDLIAKKKIHKIYLALVHGRLRYQENQWSDYIYKHPKTPNKMKVCNSPNTYQTFPIETNVSLIKEDGKYSLVKVELITGKKHQIRAHLSYYKNPIVGDYKYSNQKYDSAIKSQILIANEIKFVMEKNNPLAYLNAKRFKKIDEQKIKIDDLLKNYL
ncbi:MAG: pseudouridine synthase [Mycoplasmoidaceae bacterium]